MAGETLSTNLPLIVDKIKGSSYKYLVASTLMRQLCKPCGVGEKGNSYAEPIWDPSGVTASVLTEGTDFTYRQAYVNTQATFSSKEYGVYTYITDHVKEDAIESVVDEHSRAHGITHGVKLDASLCKLFGSFTGTVTSSATAGLELKKISAAKAIMIGGTKVPGDSMYLVAHPYQWDPFFNNMTNQTNYGVMGNLGNKVLENYFVGKLLGDITCYWDNWVPMAGTSTTARRAGLFVKDTIGIFIPRDYRLETQRFITERATKLVSTMRWGGSVRFARYGVKIKAKGSTPT